MAQETLAGLAPRPGAHCIDGTVGLGGHAKALLAASGPDGRLLGLDRDPQALALAQANLAEYGSRAVLVQTRFDAMATVARAHDFAAVDAILLDLGVSSLQLDLADRGFSFRGEGPLDMRMGPDATLTAEEIVNTWPQDRLADVIYQYGEEPLSRRIARAIIAARPLHTTTELAEVVRRASGGRSGGRRAKGHERIHPATRTFQALRIAVNQELAALEAVLPQCVELLQPGGRLAVITFHSLEDRIVKQFIQRESRDCICPPELPVCQCGHVATLRPVNRKPIQAGDAEIEANPRGRSAKLRVAERVGTGHPA